MAWVHGGFNVLAGAWPLVSMRSFEAVFGPKQDRWLEYTVAGLLAGIGFGQLKAAQGGDWRTSRRLGVATACTLLVVDLCNVPIGRIRWTYLIDAAEEIALLAAWGAVSWEE